MGTKLFENKEAPYICTPLTGKNKEEILNELNVILPKEPDLIEWRVDFLKEIYDTEQVLTIAEEISFISQLPLLFTIRAEIEGGEKIPLSDEEKVQLLIKACGSPAVDIIDFEVSSNPQHIKELRKISRENRKKLILSYHNFQFTPDLTKMMEPLVLSESFGADLAKIAVMPKNKDDVLRLLELTKQADQNLTIPIVTMSMGQLGSLSRIIGWTYGSVITFALGAHRSAPGQIPIEKLREFVETTKEIIGKWE